MTKNFLLLALIFVGCDGGQNATVSTGMVESDSKETLAEAREGFVTKIVSKGDFYGRPDVPPGDSFDLIQYQSKVGPLAAYVTQDPGDGKRHPAIVWITGGDMNSIGDVWTPNQRDNDQSVQAFGKAGVVTLFPSLRGGNDNPGQREGFYGEVDDVLAAADHLAKLSYVDPDQIYLGGHSTGGTLAILVAELTDRFRAVFSLGPVASAGQYGGQFVYCDPNDEQEMRLRSPMDWMHCVESPLYVLEGEDGNWDGAVALMAAQNTNPHLKFFKIDGFDHFNVIAPVAEILSEQIVRGEIRLTRETFTGLR